MSALGRSSGASTDHDAALDREGRFPGVTGSLRRHTARGTLVNAGFRVGISGLAFLQRMLVAIFLTPAELGVWGLVLIALIAFTFIKEAGISDKYIQQAEQDQELAFQKAFSLDVIVTAAFVVLAAAALPLFAIAYDQSSIIAPGLVLLLAIVGQTLMAPTWVYYRQMNFVRQRTLEAVQPVTMFVVTITLAAAGASYWCLVIGAVAGAWVGGAVALYFSPYRLRLVFDLGTAREYFSFSWPLVAARLSAIVIGAGTMLVGSHTVGLAGVGAIALALSVLALSDGVDAIITKTMYPAICAVRDRTSLLFESFVKSNRLALMWGVPFGLGLVLFSQDLVTFVLGDRWQPAVLLLQALGVRAALDQLGFNWTAFLRARNETRPLAVVGGVTAASFLAITVPLMIVDGLRGWAIGMVAITVIEVGARTYYLRRLFAGFGMIRHTIRAFTPILPAVAAVLLVRAVVPGERSLELAVLEFMLFCGVTAVATWEFERRLVGEVLGYLRREKVSPLSSAASQAS